MLAQIGPGFNTWQVYFNICLTEGLPECWAPQSQGLDAITLEFLRR